MVRWLVLCALTIGCIHDPTVPCGDLVCPSGAVCTPGGCATPEQLAACAMAAELAACTTKTISEGACVGGSCQPVVCGDGRVVGPEVCDDQNQRSGDGCSADCRSLEVCGNDYADVAIGEQCDSGIFGLSRDGCTSRCTIEFDSWFLVTPTLPIPRFEHAMAFDQRRHRTVVFGGRTAIANVADTLEWDGAVWRTMHPFTSPPASAQHAMAYDAHRGRIVLFGTADGATWEWDGVIWEKHVPSPSPPVRPGAGMAYDAVDQQVVLFGGSGFGDTWTWDGTTWTPHVTTPSPPSGTTQLAYEVASNRVVAFCDLSGETWGWSGSSWSQLATTGPGARQDPMLVAEHAGQVLLYGGRTGGNGLHDTWEWSGVGWTPVGPAVPHPPDTATAALAYDTDRDRVVLFGGGVFSTDARNETWEWNGTAWSQRAPQLGPGKRIVPNGVYLPLRGELVEFGDLYDSSTWVWDGSAWESRTPTTQPSARVNVGMAAMRDRALMFGGTIIPTGAENETWSWDGTNWMQQNPAHAPSARLSPAMTYDTRRDRVVLFGGYQIADTWEWDGNDWLLRSPATTPPITSARQLAYDSRRDRTVLLADGQTWEWDGTDWIARPATIPTVIAPAMTFDPTRGRVVINGADSNNSGTTETWEWDGTDWTQLPAVVGPPNAGTVLAYDRAHGELVMYAATTTGDTWVHRFFSRAVPADACLDVDTDGDGLVGCVDPDCWGRCTPACPPGETCDPSAPRCGDGVCSTLEDTRLCPGDCPP